MVSSERGLPPQFENGIVAEDPLANKYGHAVHFWNLRERRHFQAIDFGANQQIIVYRYLGLRFLRRAWLDLDRVWGASLVLAGAAGIALGK